MAKKMWTLKWKRGIDVKEMVGKIKAAIDAKNGLDPDFYNWG